MTSVYERTLADTLSAGIIEAVERRGVAAGLRFLIWQVTFTDELILVTGSPPPGLSDDGSLRLCAQWATSLDLTPSSALFGEELRSWHAEGPCFTVEVFRAT